MNRVDAIGRYREHAISQGLDAGRADDVPEGEAGKWRIAKFTVTEKDEELERMRALFGGGRWTPAGDYTRLSRGGLIVMSDTPDELTDMAGFLDQLRWLKAERVLIHGLGLGCAVRIALAQPTVQHVDVVEMSPEVLQLVGPTFDDERLAIHEGDAYTFAFPRGVRWDVAWHDIWDYISSENDTATLHRRYGRRVRWQESWCRGRARW